MLVEAMNNIDRESYVEVVWDSTRSEELQSARGIVTKIVYDRDGNKQIQFRRDDGQLMIVKDDYNIYSAGSHFSLTGSVQEINVI